MSFSCNLEEMQSKTTESKTAALSGT